MDKKVLGRIIVILENTEDFYVPVKKLWKDLHCEGYKLPSLDEFLTKLKKDKQFELHDTKKAWGDDEEEEMEQLGYYSGQRIKLRSRKITKKDMQRITLKHAQNTINNLIEAYKTKPQDLSEEAEDELIELMKRSKKLKEEIDKLFDKDSRTGM